MTVYFELPVWTYATYPVVVFQCAALVGFHKGGREIGWWTMAVGAAMTTSGAIIQIPFHTIGLSPIETAVHWAEILLILTALGSLLFAVGVAIKANRDSRLGARISELEMMNLAQATELERLRNR